MRRTAVVSMTLLASAWLQTAQAADETSTPPEGAVVAKKTRDEIPPTFVPVLQIAGNGDKSISVKGGADIRILSGIDTVWAVSPTLVVNASGANAALLTVGGDLSTSTKLSDLGGASSNIANVSPAVSAWSAGVNAEYSWLPPPTELDRGGALARTEAKTREDAAVSCEDSFGATPAPPGAAGPVPPNSWKALCSSGGQLPPGSDPSDILFCRQLALGRSLATISAGDLCKEGRAAYETATKPMASEASVIRRLSYAFPVYDISLWLGGGQGLFKYLQSNNALVDPPVYVPVSETHPNLSAAAAFTYVQKGPSNLGMTVEVFGSVQAMYMASGTSGTWCTVKGSLPGSGGASNSISSCTTATLNAPSSATTTSVAAYVGLVDKGNALWRAAIGPSLSNNLDAGTRTLGVGLPIYVDIAPVVRGVGTRQGNTSSAEAYSDYSGIVRVTPTVQYSTLAGGGNDAEFFVTFAFLAQRNMFQKADALVN